MKLSTKYRYLLMLVGLSTAFAFLSLALLVPGFVSEGDRIRERWATLLSYSIELASSDPKRLRNLLLSVAAPGEGVPKIRVSLLDDKANCMLTLGSNVCPVEASTFEKPTEPYRFLRKKGGAFWSFEGSVKVRSPVASYVFFEFDRFGPIYQKATRTGFFFSLWIVFGCAFISHFLILSFFRLRAREVMEVLGKIVQGDLKARFKLKGVDESGRLMIFFNRMADELERVVEKLKHAQQSRRHLLQEIGHDTRTPLTSIRTSLETLETSFDSLRSEDAKRFITIAFQEVQYVQSLIDDLFFLADLEEPLYQKEAHKINLGEMIQEEIHKRGEQVKLAHKQVTIVLEKSRVKNPFILGNKSLLIRLFRNALDNAVKYTNTKVTVMVQESDSGSLLVKVMDDGAGVSEVDLKKFGQREFRRELKGVLAEQTSLGLGSVIMREIAALHGGTVRLSAGEHGGACLEIEFQRNLARLAA